MTSEHTPGPWMRAGANGEKVVSGGGQTICLYLSPPNQKANAALIAAAPETAAERDSLKAINAELMATLLRAQPVIDDATERLVDTVHPFTADDLQMISDAVRAAIANAKGCGSS